MDVRAAILALVQLWAQPATPPEYMPESPAAYHEREETIVDGAIAETASLRETMAVLRLWREESRFLREVHSGEIRGDNGLAICLGSIHPSARIADWEGLAGTSLEATRRCAHETIRVLRYGLENCAPRQGKPSERMAFSFEYYARGHCAEPCATSRKRGELWASDVAKVRKAMAEREAG